MASEKLKVGIIGTGIHGARYARHILEDVPALDLVAISRRSAEGGKQARDWNCRYHSNWRALLEDAEVDAIIAVLTPNLHADIAEACATSGKPLLLEKPLAVDAASGSRVLAAADDVPITVAQTLRYNPVIRALRDELSRAGELYSFSADQRLEPSTHPWLTDPAVAGGGVILHTAVHLFDALRFITGRQIEAVRGQAWKRHNPNLEDHFLGELCLAGDICGSVEVSKIGPARSGRYAFVGSEGTLVGDQIHGSLEFIRGAKIETLAKFEALPTLPLLLDDWHRFLRGEGENPISAEDGYAALRVCAAARQAAKDGDWVVA
ncbi:Gfo/Idh/MocA family oxidoreductase [bacterium]|nr:Gfo/Idh/MocA family oxidoreductase [bacterium]